MKNPFFFLIILATIIIANSCAKESTEKQQVDDAQVDIAVEEAIQAVLIEDILQAVDAYSNFGEGMLKSALVEDEGCPVISAERVKKDKSWPRKVTINFGDSCMHRDKMKSGKIVIVKTDKWENPGSVREVSFHNYMVEGVAIAGHKRIENTTEEDSPTFALEVNLELTSTTKDGIVKTVKRKADKTQTWLAGFNDGNRTNNSYLIAGEARIVVTKGNVDKVVEKNMFDLLMVQGCKFPQDGETDFAIKTFDDTKLAFNLNYGKPEIGEVCDSKVELTIGDEVTELDLAEKWWKEVKK